MTSSTVAAIEAYESGSLAFSANAQGFLLIYVLGAVKVLGDLGLVGPEVTTAAAGTASLISAAVCSRTQYNHILEVLQQYWKGSQDPLQPLEYRREHLRKAADQIIAANAHNLCSDRTFISKVQEVDGRGNSKEGVASAANAVHLQVTPVAVPPTSAQPMSSFASRAALLDAIVDSSFPVPESPSSQQTEPAAAAAVDLARFLNTAAGHNPPCPAGTMYCVTITAVPPSAAETSNSGSSAVVHANQYEKHGAIFILQPESTASATSSSSSSAVVVEAGASAGDVAVRSSSNRVLQSWNQHEGKTRDSPSTESLSASNNGSSSSHGISAARTAVEAAVKPALLSSAADIWPGLSQRMTIPRSEWLSYITLAPPVPVMDYMHYLGRVDAYIWANTTGLVKAAVREQQQELEAALIQMITSTNSVDALFNDFVHWPSTGSGE